MKSLILNPSVKITIILHNSKKKIWRTELKLTYKKLNWKNGNEQWTRILALPFHEKRFSRFWNVFFLFCLPRFFINPSPVAFKNYALCLFVQMNVNSYDTRFQIKWQFIEFRKYAHHNIFKSKILVIDKNIFLVHLLWLKPLHKCQFCLCL